MANMTEAQFNKLPRYAQEEISYLRMREDELLKALSKANHTTEGPVAIVDNYQDEFTRPALFGNEEITFRVDGKKFSKGEDGYYVSGFSIPQISVGLDRHDRQLVIRSAQGSLSVTPSASNSLFVGVKDH